MDHQLDALHIMSKDLPYVLDKTSIHDAAKKMVKSETNVLAVKKGRSYIGFLTSFDIMETMVKELDPNSPVRECLEKPVGVSHDTPMYQVMQIMKENNMTVLPVIKSSRIIGFITDRRISNYVAHFNKIMQSKMQSSIKDALGKFSKPKKYDNMPEWAEKEMELLEQIAKQQSQIAAKISKTKSRSLIDWRTFIWENCKFKYQSIANDEIVYMCKKLKKRCTYAECPLI